MKMIGNISMAIGWLLITFAQHPAMLIYGRITAGLSRGFLGTCFAVIIQTFFKDALLKSLPFTTSSIAMTRPLNFV
jgi:hypothetical protein